MKHEVLTSFDNEFAKTIFYRELEIKFDEYNISREDTKDGFEMVIKKFGNTIVNISYGKNGGVVTNIGASQEEISSVLKTLNTAFQKKSYVRAPK